MKSQRFDMSRGETYDFIGKKEIKLKTTNGMKMTYTMILAVLEDGIKLPPVFIFKSRNPIALTTKKRYNNIALFFSNSTGCNNEEIMQEWCDKIWLNIKLHKRQELVLIMDKFAVHTKQTILS